MANVNYRSIRRKIADSKKLQILVDAKAKEKFENAKERFMNNFENHPVTTEIEDGPEALNKSGTLGGIGNLFSFIGFNKGENPISDIKSYIENSFNLSKSTKSTSGAKVKFNYKIKYPGIEEISKISPMPWENGRSWILGIERGISGFGNYMYKKVNKSRSGAGAQVQNELRSGSFKTKSYMSEIIQKFISSLKS
jgi:hypothetical protein